MENYKNTSENQHIFDIYEINIFSSKTSWWVWTSCFFVLFFCGGWGGGFCFDNRHGATLTPDLYIKQQSHLVWREVELLWRQSFWKVGTQNQQSVMICSVEFNQVNRCWFFFCRMKFTAAFLVLFLLVLMPAPAEGFLGMLIHGIVHGKLVELKI